MYDTLHRRRRPRRARHLDWSIYAAFMQMSSKCAQGLPISTPNDFAMLFCLLYT